MRGPWGHRRGDGGCGKGTWLDGKIRGCGYRMTVGRQVILDVLSESDQHVSAEDIYIKVHPRCPNVGLTTVYRTLDILAGLGLVAKFDFGDGRARYEMADGPKGPRHHHHLVCTRCKRVIDYTDFIDEEIRLLTDTEKGLSKKYDFQITNHQIQFYGLCSKCKKIK